jgi:hypothetical protein
MDRTGAGTAAGHTVLSHPAALWFKVGRRGAGFDDLDQLGQLDEAANDDASN